MNPVEAVKVRKKPGPKHPRVPLVYWHRLLWEKADSRRRVRLHVREWAEELGRDFGTTHYFVHRLREAGRIRPVAVGAHRLVTYEITDPDEYHALMPQRPLRWG